jgi:hypothetical protein
LETRANDPLPLSGAEIRKQEQMAIKEDPEYYRDQETRANGPGKAKIASLKKETIESKWPSCHSLEQEGQNTTEITLMPVSGPGWSGNESKWPSGEGRPRILQKIRFRARGETLAIQTPK